MTFCAKQTSRRNGRNCCAISTGCRMCVSSIGGPIGWCARTRPETSRLCSVTLISGCHRVPGKPRLRRLHHRHRPTNAAVAQSVVPRRLEFRRNSHEIRDLQKLTVQVGCEFRQGFCRLSGANRRNEKGQPQKWRPGFHTATCDSSCSRGQLLLRRIHLNKDLPVPRAVQAVGRIHPRQRLSHAATARHLDRRLSPECYRSLTEHRR